MLALLEAEQLVRGTAAALETASDRGTGGRAAGANAAQGLRDQLGLFAQPNPIVERLAALDVNSMTPLEALSRLAGLVDDAKRSR